VGHKSPISTQSIFPGLSHVSVKARRSIVGLDLDAFLAQFHHISRALTPQTANGCNLLKERSDVAWLLTSALGVTLDWQVQGKKTP